MHQCGFYHSTARFPRVNIMSALHRGNTMSRNEYLQQYATLHARIKHREKAIQELKQHLKHGTFPKRMKTLKPYPTMETLEAQAVVNEVCQQADQVILEQRVQDYERKLQGDRASLQTLKETRKEHRQQQLKATETLKTSKKERMTVLQLQQELRDLQAKYTALSQKLTPPKTPNSKDILSEQEPQET